MNDRVNTLACLAIALMMLGSAPAEVVAQTPSAPNTPAVASTERTPGTWVVPRTPNGQPDLQGYWTSLSFTPFERPEQYGTREFLTDEEMQELFQAGVDRSYEFTFANASDVPVYDATVYGLDAWQNGVQPNGRTSQVVDPANGRLPPMTPEGQARPRGGGRREGPFDVPEDLTTGVRCLTFGGPPIPAGSNYNNNTFILQGKDHVVIEYEWGSTTRVVPLDGRPHLSSAISSWRGDARGHWDGDSLVIETINFKPGYGPRNSDAATVRMTERFTRISETTIEYRYTIDDPSTWTSPWTATTPLSKVDGPLFEYACHEGNNGLVNMMEGSRALEKQAEGPQ